MVRLALTVIIAGLCASLASAAAAKSAKKAKKKPLRATRIAMVFEDARLFTRPSAQSPSFRAANRVMPRASRPFLLVSKKDGWVRLQSFSTADTGRMPVCPFGALVDLQVHLFVREADIAKRIDLKSLPKRQSAALEYQLDACRNPDANPIAFEPEKDSPASFIPDYEAPPVGIGPYLEPATSLFWESGEAAGQTRFAVALPMQTFWRNGRTCFERTLTGVGMPGAFDQRMTLCVPRDRVKRR